jgi:hypothetical protein
MAVMEGPVTPQAWVRDLNRADLAVLALGLLGTGNLWAQRGAANGFHQGEPELFIGGLTMVAVAGALCFVAMGRSPARPRPVVCAAAILMQILVPAYVMSLPLLVVTGAALASVPFIRNPRLACLPLALGAALVAYSTITSWTWGQSGNDVFSVVQGSTLALLHGQNPYAPVYPIYLDSPLHHVVYGSASFDYGPAVVLLSLPAALIGDVRLAMVALNVAILAAALVWLRRARFDSRLGLTVVALWLMSPLIPVMILNAWTDTFCVAGLAWWLVLRDHHRNWSVALLALAFACKPTILPLLLPLLFWVRMGWRELLWAIFGALLIVAPFALWTGVAQFVYDTVFIFGDLPARRDSLDLNGLSSALGGGLLPAPLLLLGTLAAIAGFTLRRPRDYGDLLAAGAGLMIVVCFFAKQAFLNYYYNGAIALLFVVGSGSMRPVAAIRNPVTQLAAAVRRQRRPAAVAPGS